MTTPISDIPQAERKPETDPEVLAAIARATEATGYSSLSLVSMAQVASIYADNKEAMRAIQSIYGRSPRHMATAVAYWPQHFTPDTAPDYDPDFYFALFAAARLPESEADALEERIRTEHLPSWQVNELVNNRAEGGTVDLRSRWGMVHIHKTPMRLRSIGDGRTTITFTISTPTGESKLKLEALDGSDTNLRVHRWLKPGRKASASKKRKKAKPKPRKQRKEPKPKPPSKFPFRKKAAPSWRTSMGQQPPASGAGSIGPDPEATEREERSGLQAHVQDSGGGQTPQS